MDIKKFRKDYDKVLKQIANVTDVNGDGKFDLKDMKVMSLVGLKVGGRAGIKLVPGLGIASLGFDVANQVRKSGGTRRAADSAEKALNKLLKQYKLK